MVKNEDLGTNLPRFDCWLGHFSSHVPLDKWWQLSEPWFPPPLHKRIKIIPLYRFYEDEINAPI